VGDECWAKGYVTFDSYDGQNETSVDSAGAPGPWNDGRWHHFAGVRDGTNTQSIFVDGDLRARVACDPDRQSIHNAAPITIGGYVGYLASETASRTYVGSYQGSIDEVRIWNVASTGREIRADMNSGLAGSEAGLVGLWNFDEGGGPVVHDSTVDDNDGTVLSAPQWVEATWPAEP
jgi:hypothetical protein